MRTKSGFPWGFTLIWLPILSLMIWAGFWQLDRAGQKERIQEQMTQGRVAIPQQASDWQDIADYQPVRIKGYYRNVHFLLANQFHQSQVGFHVYSVFQSQHGSLILINRGWIASPERDLSTPQEPLTIKGFMSAWPRPGIQLGEQDLLDKAQQQVTYLPLKQTHKFMAQQLCPKATCDIRKRIIKLNAMSDYGFVRDWQAPIMTADRHRAYAFQWFMMSLALCLIYVYFLWKNNASKK